ncbi:MAG: hypothetical protein BGP05_13415 [Rhizobiales bacterium 62-47]|nr:MAG: hypothetical protein BGP05_13415 [Rhizobiales bacterium 62-47]
MLCEGRGGGLADAVSRTMWQVRLAAPILELVAKAVRSERFAKLGEEERLAARLGRRDAGLKVGVEGDVQIDRVAVLILGLPVLYAATVNVFRPDPHHVLTTKRDVAQEVKREACLSADRVPLLVLRYLCIGPSVMTIAGVFDALNA